MNRFSYALNNPTKYTDPTGHCAEPLTFTVCAAVVGAGAYFLHAGYQQVFEGRELYTMDPTRGVEAGRAAKVGVGTTALVISGGTAGLPATAAFFGGGAALNVAEQAILENKRSVGEIDWEGAYMWGGVSALPGAGAIRAIEAGGRIAQVARAGVTVAGAWGAYRGGAMAVEGYQEDNWEKVGLGAVEGSLGLFGAAWGARGFARGGGFRGLIEEPAPLSPGARLRQQYGERFDEYARFRRQGYTARGSRDLIRPYEGMHQHFIQRQHFRRWIAQAGPNSWRGRFLAWYMDSPLNVRSGAGMSQGRFYEWHSRFHGQRTIFGGRTAQGMRMARGEGWQAIRVNPPLRPYGDLGYLWQSSPTALRLTVGAGMAGGAAAVGSYFSDDDDDEPLPEPWQQSHPDLE